jgi:uncharacterized protein DUF2478
VVIAVSSLHFTDWIKFVGGMTVKLTCSRDALDGWWQNVSARLPRPAEGGPETFCEIAK